jgi:GAF domain-containing protein
MTDPAARLGDAMEGQPVMLPPALGQLAGVVMSQETVQTALELVTTLAETVIPGTTGAGVTLVDERGKRSRAASNQAVERADALQYELDEGPCLAAWRSRQPVRIDDTTTDSRWPAWGSAAGRMGVRSVVSAPLVVADESIGAIKVYSDRASNYDEQDEHVISLFGGQAAILLANTQSLQEARRLSRQLAEALRSRDAIARATGVLLAQGAADEGAAFTVLTDAAQRSGRTVETVARDLLSAVVARNADRSPA